MNELLEARDDKRLLRFQKQLAKQDLLIVDELGYVPLSKTGSVGGWRSITQLARYTHPTAASKLAAVNAVGGAVPARFQSRDNHVRSETRSIS